MPVLSNLSAKQSEIIIPQIRGMNLPVNEIPSAHLQVGKNVIWWGLVIYKHLDFQVGQIAAHLELRMCLRGVSVAIYLSQVGMKNAHLKKAGNINRD